MAITRSRFKLSGLEQRRFGEFNEVTEESEFQNPAPVTKAIILSRRFELRLKLRAASFSSLSGDLGLWWSC